MSERNWGDEIMALTHSDLENGVHEQLADAVQAEFATLEARLSRMEELLYEAIEMGGAPESTWVDTDDETRRAWPISDEEALAGDEKT